MKKIILAFFALLLFSSIGFSQTDKDLLGVLSIKTGKGFLFINNNDDKSFSIEISGSDVKPQEDLNVPAFSVDGKIVQILSVPLTNFAPENKKLSDEELLEAHKLWESNYLSTDIYKEKLKVESTKVKLGEKRDALFWGFTRPKFNQEFKHEYFLTTVVGKTLLAIGSPVGENETIEGTKKILMEIMVTLKVSEKPFDIEKLSESIRKSAN